MSSVNLWILFGFCFIISVAGAGPEAHPGFVLSFAIPTFYVLKFLFNSGYISKVLENPVVVEVSVKEPSDFLFEIENYQEFLNSAERSGSDRIESSEFNAGGHSWVLVMYPNGNKKENGSDYVSLYLRLVNKPAEGGAVFALFKFFLFNKEREDYITISDNKVRCFDAARLEWGIAQALSLSTLHNEYGGLLINNSCILGAEVYVTKNIATVARLSLVEKKTLRTNTWPVYDYSTFTADLYSPSFHMESRSWKLRLYPRGNLSGQGKYLSLYLYLEDLTDLIGGRKLYVECTLSIRDQINGNDHIQTVGFWFDSNNDHCGFDMFISLAELNSPAKGYEQGDTLYIEANLNEMFMLQEIN